MGKTASIEQIFEKYPNINDAFRRYSVAEQNTSTLKISGTDYFQLSQEEVDLLCQYAQEKGVGDIEILPTID